MLSYYHINYDHRLSVAIHLTSAVKYLPVFEGAHPTDLRPRQTLITVMQWLQGEATAMECEVAAKMSYAAYSDYNIANLNDLYAHGAYIAYIAAYTASKSLIAVAKPQTNVGSEYIHDKLLQLLPRILDYKIENQQKFNLPEEVFEYLDNNDKDKFIFNLDILT